MTEKQYEDARYIKSEIKMLNDLLDNIEKQQKKCEDKGLENILVWAHTKAFNEISKQESRFREL